jgi:hypothetical protein
MGKNIKALNDLHKATEKAVGLVAAEFDFARELLDDLQEIQTHRDPNNLRPIRKGFRLLRWIGRAERKVDRSLKNNLKELEQLNNILPPSLKPKKDDLASKLTIAQRQLITLASTFRGRVKGELDSILKDQKQLDRYSKNPEEAERLRFNLQIMLKLAEGDVQKLVTWTSSVEAILKELEQYEKELEKMAA